ncbi:MULTISPECIES: GAF and ANTAR domain-containing protein [unclassified Curtobacterium]|uniref:GAF and ANTAR domain-containing protein n=1 Tax=unclassified Curtobacterium TaxID=257496 RepID=UPI000DA6F7C8|nr:MULTISPECIES: GAF and ANTAR domain-containing protein [unclassified Curtobacterium]PZE24167.1 hypothetical protein DEI86_12945 [Curtobacterium sp. MCBD17_028]PZE73375.1 hypothetical protein DEI82_14415 [Curtobacterium sp. MCBD17_019]
MSGEFERTLSALRSGRVRDADLSVPFVRLLPVRGCSVSSFGVPFGNETISASDITASRIDEIQFDLHEGPCWEAIRRAQPVLEDDIRHRASRSWPAFTEAVRHEAVGALFAFPVMFGPLRLGAVDLYAPEPTPLEPEQVEQASLLSTAVGRRILQRSIASIGVGGAVLDRAPSSRRMVHQATGVVLAQLDITAEDAYLLLQGHAFARRRPTREIAEDVLSGKLRFERRGGLIEESE